MDMNPASIIMLLLELHALEWSAEDLPISD